MQISHADILLDHPNKRYEPLAFLSGHFDKTQLCWFTHENKAFSIMATVKRLYFMVSNPDCFDLSKDHIYLIVIFDLLLLVPDLSQPSLAK